MADLGSTCLQDGIRHEDSFMVEVQARLDVLEANGSLESATSQRPAELLKQWELWRSTWQELMQVKSQQQRHKQRQAVGTLLNSTSSPKLGPCFHIPSASPMIGRSAATPATPATVSRFSISKRAPKRICLMSFRWTVITAIVLSVIICSIVTYVPMDVLTKHLMESADKSYLEALSDEEDFIKNMTLEETMTSAYSDLLASVANMVQMYVKMPAEAAVDCMQVFLSTEKRFNPQFSGCTPEDQDKIAYAAMARMRLLRAELSARAKTKRFFVFDATRKPRIDWLLVSFSCGATSGFRFRYSAGADPIPTELILQAPAKVGNMTMNLSTWRVSASGDPIAPPDSIYVNFNPFDRPFYALQKSIADEAKLSPGGAVSVPSKRLWSQLVTFWDGNPGFLFTSPVAYCENYSCFEGSVAASFNPQLLSWDLDDQWLQTRDVLLSVWGETITAETSTIFIVCQKSLIYEQQGTLIGESGINFEHFIKSENSKRRIVKDTVGALMMRFKRWDAPELEMQQLISYKPSALADDCSPNSLDLTKWDLGDCYQVGTLSMAMDNKTSWLLVVVMPLGAFTSQAASLAQDVALSVREIKASSAIHQEQVRNIGVGVFFSLTVTAVAISICIGLFMTRGLHQLSNLMGRLRDLDFAKECREFEVLRSGRRSRINELDELQEAFCRLSVSIEAFARFVPESVVRSVVRGDPRATRLHVTRRHVTILFSDLRNFTTIAESLSQKDLLFLLTRYLSVVTHIVELFQGVVAEILGDGVLAYWNTPEDVHDHASKACAAAVAQQQAMHFLNAELGVMDIPELAVRIGLHTGHALTGNIGTSRKMKFGCMGDPVNLASRLEGLCKYYGVSIICSEETKELAEASGIVTRKLDLVQVKGRSEATTIYEIMGRAGESALGARERTSICVGDVSLHDVELGTSRPSSGESVLELPLAVPGIGSLAVDKDPFLEHLSAERRCCTLLYEDALAKFQAARFAEAVEMLRRILAKQPDDIAASLLLERASHYIDSAGNVIGLSAEELTAWTGVNFMTEK